jgi:ABC-type transport system substrate-binding protein
MVLERNPHYRDPARQRAERIVLLENVPRDVQFLMFERGELDTIDRPSAPDLMWISGRDDWKPYIQTQPQLTVFGLRMDVRKKPFDDRRVRQALNYALNKRYTVKLLAGTATPSHGMLPPALIGRDDTLEPYPYDPAKARALLAEAGYGSGLTLEYVTIPEDDAQKLTPSMIADFAAVGVTLKVSEVSWATYVTQVGKAEGGLPFSFAGWFGDFADPAAFLTAKFHSRAIATESSQNDSFYANPELDRVLDEASAAPDPELRAKLYRRADRIVHDDAPWVWNYHQLTIEVSQPYVRDFKLHPSWARDLTTAWLDLGPDGEPVPR